MWCEVSSGPPLGSVLVSVPMLGSSEDITTRCMTESGYGKFMLARRAPRNLTGIYVASYAEVPECTCPCTVRGRQYLGQQRK